MVKEVVRKVRSGSWLCTDWQARAGKSQLAAGGRGALEKDLFKLTGHGPKLGSYRVSMSHYVTASKHNALSAP